MFLLLLLFSCGFCFHCTLSSLPASYLTLSYSCINFVLQFAPHHSLFNRRVISCITFYSFSVVMSISSLIEDQSLEAKAKENAISREIKGYFFAAQLLLALSLVLYSFY